MVNRLEIAIREHRANLRAIDRAAFALILQTYADVSDRLQPMIERLIQQAEEQGALTPAQLFRLQRFVELQRQLAEEMARLSAITGQVTSAAQERAVGIALDDALPIALATAQGQQAVTAVTIGFTQVPFSAVEDLIGATRSGPLADLLATFGDVAQRVMIEEITNGLALGYSPRKTAANMQRALDISRNRALTIARTETLRAYRSATLRTYTANSDVIRGWRWVAAHQARTCAACLAMDNTIHELSETMHAHPNCRCVQIPVLRNARMRSYQSARQWFDTQPAETQDAVLGKAGGAAYRAGAVELDDFVREDHSADWGTSIRDGGIGWALANAAQRDRRAA